MRLADKIAKHLRDYVRGAGREIILQNFYHLYYEMDVLRLMPSGLIVEYEIKISRSDYFNDFKKSHRNYKSSEDKPDIILKHDWMKTGKGPNRFFFVTPKGLIKLSELPDYAGLIEFNESKDHQWFSLIRNSKVTHKNKFPDAKYKELAELLAFRESNLRNSVWFYKYEAKQEKEKNKNLLKIIQDNKIVIG